MSGVTTATIHNRIGPTEWFWVTMPKRLCRWGRLWHANSRKWRSPPVWQEYIPHIPYDYTFLDDVFKRMYNVEYRLGRITLILSLVAILIACLGVLGLTAYMTARRTKEVAIRKVLGAPTPSLVRLLSSEMLVLVALANVIAWPVVYLVILWWLQQFAYQADVSEVLFILAGFSLLAMALLTVGYHALKTAGANPVDALRCE